MSKVNYAAIDIGSNAVRLLIKSINPETSEQLFTKELLLRVPLRLGEEVFTQGEIPASKAKKLLRLMAWPDPAGHRPAGGTWKRSAPPAGSRNGR